MDTNYDCDDPDWNISEDSDIEDEIISDLDENKDELDDNKGELDDLDENTTTKESRWVCIYILTRGWPVPEIQNSEYTVQYSDTG